MNNYKKLADLIFPEITETIEDLEKKYPNRDLPEGAKEGELFEVTYRIKVSATSNYAQFFFAP